MTKYQRYVDEIAALKAKLAEAEKEIEDIGSGWQNALIEVEELESKLAAVRAFSVELFDTIAYSEIVSDDKAGEIVDLIRTALDRILEE